MMYSKIIKNRFIRDDNKYKDVFYLDKENIVRKIDVAPLKSNDTIENALKNFIDLTKGKRTFSNGETYFNAMNNPELEQLDLSIFEEPEAENGELQEAIIKELDFMLENKNITNEYTFLFKDKLIITPLEASKLNNTFNALLLLNMQLREAKETIAVQEAAAQIAFKGANDLASEILARPCWYSIKANIEEDKKLTYSLIKGYKASKIVDRVNKEDINFLNPDTVIAAFNIDDTKYKYLPPYYYSIALFIKRITEEAAEKIKNSLPDTRIKTCDIFTNSLTIINYNTPYMHRVGETKEKGRVKQSRYVTLNVDDKNKDLERINYYDIGVLTYIYNYYNNENHIIKIDTLCNQLYNNKPNATVKPETAAAVIDSIEKLSNLWGEFNYNEHLYMLGKKENPELTLLDFDEPVISKRLLNINFIYDKKNPTKQAIEVLEKPVILEYAKKVNHIASMDKNVLKMPFQRTTKERIALQFYLLSIVTITDKLYLKNLYDIFNITDRRKKAPIQADVTKLLDYWQQIGYIRSYKFIIDEKKNIIGYEIENPDRRTAKNTKKLK